MNQGGAGVPLPPHLCSLFPDSHIKPCACRMQLHKALPQLIIQPVRHLAVSQLHHHHLSRPKGTTQIMVRSRLCHTPMRCCTA